MEFSYTGSDEPVAASGHGLPPVHKILFLRGFCPEEEAADTNRPVVFEKPASVQGMILFFDIFITVIVAIGRLLLAFSYVLRHTRCEKINIRFQCMLLYI